MIPLPSLYNVLPTPLPAYRYPSPPPLKRAYPTPYLFPPLTAYRPPDKRLNNIFTLDFPYKTTYPRPFLPDYRYPPPFLSQITINDYPPPITWITSPSLTITSSFSQAPPPLLLTRLPYYTIPRLKDPAYQPHQIKRLPPALFPLLPTASPSSPVKRSRVIPYTVKKINLFPLFYTSPSSFPLFTRLPDTPDYPDKPPSRSATKLTVSFPPRTDPPGLPD